MRFSASPTRIGSIGAVRSSAWIWDFSSTQSTIAFSGGATYRPTTSVTFATSSGSVENVSVSDFHGCTPYSRHARATVAFPIVTCVASSREDQCVTPYFFGGAANVAATISARSRRFGRPERGASASPSSPASAYRFRHFHTDVVVVPTSTAIRALAIPSDASSTILARCTKPARIDVDRTHDINSALSPSRSRKAGAGEFAITNSPKPKQFRN